MNSLLTSLYTRHLLQHHLGYLIGRRHQIGEVSDLMLITVVHKIYHLLTLPAQSWWLRLQRPLVCVQGLKSPQQRHVLFFHLGQLLLLSHHQFLTLSHHLPTRSVNFERNRRLLSRLLVPPIGLPLIGRIVVVITSTSITRYPLHIKTHTWLFGLKG